MQNIKNMLIYSHSGRKVCHKFMGSLQEQAFKLPVIICFNGTSIMAERYFMFV